MLFRKGSIVAPLIVANVVVFLLQLTLGDWFTNLFLLDRSQVLYMPWQLVTSMFLHGSFSHLFFNMYGLFIFGTILEPRIGTRRFIQIYLISGLVAAFAALLLYDRVLGASGALFGVIGVCVALVPNMRFLFMFAIPMSLKAMAVLWVALDVFGLFSPSGTANLAHLAGIAVGYGYGRYLKRRQKPVARKIESSFELSEEDMDNYIKYGRL